MKLAAFLLFLSICNYSLTQELTLVMNKDYKIGFVNAQNDTIFKYQFDRIQYNQFGSKANPTCIVAAGNKYGLISASGKFLQPVGLDSIYVSSKKHNLHGYKKDGKHGLINAHTGEILLNANYDDLIDFGYADYAKIDLNEKVGVLDKNGKILIPANHESLDMESKGLIQAKKGGKYGFFNYSGALVISFIYESVNRIQSDVNRIQVKKDGKWGIIDFKGKVIAPFEYDNIRSYMNGLVVATKDNKDRYLDLNGKWKFNKTFDYAESFFEKVTFVGKESADSEEMKFALIDNKGNLLSAYKYDDYEDLFYDGFSIIQVGEHYGAVNYKGKEIVEPIFARVEINSEFYTGESTYIAIMKSPIQIYDKEGKALLKDKYDFISEVEHETIFDLVQVGKNGLYGYVRLSTGREIIPCQFIEIQPYMFEEHEFIRVKSPDGYGVWDLKREKLLVPAQFEKIFDNEFSSSDGLFHVYKDDKQGVWNSKINKLIVPIQFDEVNNDVDVPRKFGIFFMGYNDDKWILFDEFGKIIIPKGSGNIPEILVSDGQLYFVVYDNEKERFGLIGKDGTVILEPIYNEINGIKKGEVNVDVDGVSKMVKLKKSK